MRIFTGGLMLTLAVAACGDGGAGTGPVTADTAQDGCRADCQHDQMCEPTVDVAACTASCVEDVVGTVRADVFEDFIACNATVACGASNDHCEAMCQPTAAHQSYADKCQAVLSTCGDPELLVLCDVTPTGSGDAGFLCVIVPEIVNDLAGCFDAGTTCDAALTCFQTRSAAHGLDF